MLELIVSFLLVAGAAFALVGSIGLARLPDIYLRLHAPTKATTLGVGGMLAGSVLYFTVQTATPSVEQVLITVFLFVTAPVSAHLIAKAAIHRGLAAVCGPPPPAPADPDAAATRPHT